MQEFKLSPETQEALNSAAHGIEISPEAYEELVRAAQAMAEAFYDAWEALIVIVEKTMAEFRRIAIELGRFFLKQQLLEWRVPPRISGYIARHLHWRWAVRLGSGWFDRKLLL